MRPSRYLVLLLGAAMLLAVAPASGSGPERSEDPGAYWTPARRAAAIPRDLVVGPGGEGYLRLPNGTLQPYGSGAEPQAKPGGGSDATGPTVSDPRPADETVTTSDATFSATVNDDSGVRSVTFHVTSPANVTTSYTASGPSTGGTWSASVTGLTTGAWSWRIEARDRVKRGGGNLTSTDAVAFSVDLGTGGGDGGGSDPGGVIVNDPWLTAGDLQTAAGRIYFEMRSSRNRWSGYVCSGTVATDDTTGRSVIITAAHCVYDDVYKEFARNVLFIPDQDGTSGTGTNRDCADDPLGCWKPSYGVVDSNWAGRSWPDNIPWDYAYYVVEDGDASHDPGVTGDTTANVLDVVAKSAPVQFTAPTQGAYTHALGYSYSDDPNLMYCAEGLATDGGASSDPLWLGSCGLSGGASGGPWVQPMGTDGTGPIVSVNSYGYSNRAGMGGPHLSGNSAQCLFGLAKTTTDSVATTC